MSTPDDLKRYRRLSETLRQIGKAYSSELPRETASLHLHSPDGHMRLDAYSRTGQIIAKLRAVQLSEPFRKAIEQLARERCPDPFGVVSPL